MTARWCGCGQPITANSSLCNKCITARNERIRVLWPTTPNKDIAAEFNISVPNLLSIAKRYCLRSKRQLYAQLVAQNPPPPEPQRSTRTGIMRGFTLPGVTQGFDPHRVLGPPKTCAWPLGEPRSAGFRFCGRESEPGRPYCDEHAGIAYLPTRSKRDDASDHP